MVEMQDGDILRRNAYSLISDPEDGSGYEIAVQREDQGRGGSLFMHEQARPGMVMRIGSPVNLFGLNLMARKHLMIAGGVGITPFIAQTRELQRLGLPYELHYAVRARDELASVVGTASAAVTYARRVEVDRATAVPMVVAAFVGSGLGALLATVAPGEALRIAACWVADCGSWDHPEYRAEQALHRLLRLHGVGLDHHARAFLALVAALRYEAESDAPFLLAGRSLLDPVAASRAEVIGTALRLAYTLSAGTPDLLGRTRLQRDGGRLTLHLSEGGGVFAGESIVRRLGRLAGAMGLEAGVE